MRILAIASLLASSAACGYEAFSGAEETDAILTIREPDRDFSALGTFVMPNEVFDLSDIARDPRDRDTSKDDLILDEVADGLTDYGWQRLDENGTEEPDVIVLVGVVAQDNWSFYSYSNCYYPYYYYCYYPPAFAAVNYPVGSLFITMMKPDEATIGENDEEIVPVIWAAATSGLLGSSGRVNTSRITEVVEQAYAQSDYLDLD